MGEMEVPADALYGASTQRAVLNFPISGTRSAGAVSCARWRWSSWPPPRPTGSSGCSTPMSRPPSPPRRPRSPTGGHDDQFPIDIYQTGSGTSTNTNMNEVVAHLASDAPRVAAHGPPERRRQPLPELERHDPDGAPAVGRDRDRGRAAARPRAPPHRARGQGAGALAGRQDRPDPPPGRDADPARPGVPRLRRPGRGIAPAGAGRPGRAARRCRSAGPRSGPGINAHPEYAFRACARLSALTGLTVREATNHFHAQATLDAAIAAHGAIRTIALSLWKIASRRPADGDGPARGHRRAGAARDPAGVEHHARQGEPGHRREPDDGRRAGRRQRRDGRLRADRELPRAQRDAAGDRRRDARVDLAPGRGRRQLQRPLHRGR